MEFRPGLLLEISAGIVTFVAIAAASAFVLNLVKNTPAPVQVGSRAFVLGVLLVLIGVVLEGTNHYRPFPDDFILEVTAHVVAAAGAGSLAYTLLRSTLTTRRVGRTAERPRVKRPTGNGRPPSGEPTGAAKRPAVLEQVEYATAEARRQGKHMAVMVVDIGRFKAIGDKLGGKISDVLLPSLTQRLQAIVRSDGTVAHLGGDKFAVLQSEPGPHFDGVLDLAERITEAMKPPLEIAEHSVGASVSVGIAVFPTDGDSGEELLEKASIALDKAKVSGRSRFRPYDPALGRALHTRRQLSLDLRGALGREDELVMLYQPMVDVHAFTVVGVEALVRWKHPQRGWLEPADFLPIATAYGLAPALDEWVLRRVCRDANDWVGQTGRPFRLAVNLSAATLSSGMVRKIAGLLREFDLAPPCLAIDLTETTVDAGLSEGIVQELRRLANEGAAVAVDAYGTGAMAVSLLRRYPISIIKVDHSLVQSATSSREARETLRVLVAIANELGLELLAVGVETPDQVKLLRDEGCTVQQGYCFDYSTIRNLRRIFPSDA